MLKENGRTSKATKKETSSKKGKEFNCPNCSEKRTLANVEFGEAVYCLSCEARMEEVV